MDGWYATLWTSYLLHCAMVGNSAQLTEHVNLGRVLKWCTEELSSSVSTFSLAYIRILRSIFLVVLRLKQDDHAVAVTIALINKWVYAILKSATTAVVGIWNEEQLGKCRENYPNR